LHSKILPVLLAATVIALPAGAQTTRKARTSTRTTKSWSPTGAWRSVYSDASVKVSVDTSQTRKQSDGTYRVRLRWQYSANQMIGSAHAYRTMVDRKLIDCTTQGVKPIAAQTFDATGKPVAAYDTTDAEVSELDWAKRPPGSSAGKAYAAVCAAIRK
jgi:hypothetical protein